MSEAAAGRRWEGRHRAREAALRILYQSEIGEVALGDAIRHVTAVEAPDGFELDEDGRAYAARLAHGTWAARATLDGYIADAALNWRVERLAVIDRLVLRLALHEMLAEPATPPRVVIDEAIELARRYSGEEAARFVNGVLDAAFRALIAEGKVVDS
jgi:N utilization substance protein B